MVLNNAKPYILQNTIAKFEFDLKISKLYLYMIEYRADLIHSLYKACKKAEIYLDIPSAKTKMYKKIKMKSGYKTFKSFQTIIAPEQNPQLYLYKITLQQLSFINLTHHTKMKNKQSVIKIIQIIIQTQNRLKLCIYYKTFKFYKAFLIYK